MSMMLNMVDVTETPRVADQIGYKDGKTVADELAELTESLTPQEVEVTLTNATEVAYHDCYIENGILHFNGDIRGNYGNLQSYLKFPYKPKAVGSDKNSLRFPCTGITTGVLGICQVDGNGELFIASQKTLSNVGMIVSLSYRVAD